MNVDEFHRILHADDEQAVRIPIERIRRRARQIRVRRGAGVAVSVAVLTAAVGTLTVTLPGRGAGQQPGGPIAAATNCPTSTVRPTLLQVDFTPIDTGVVVPDHNGTQYHVILSLTGPFNDPFLTIGYRGPTGELADATTMMGVGPHLGGDFSGQYPQDPTHRFLSVQVPLGPHSVLDMGVYSRSAARISVASAGQSTDAHLRAFSTAGWTLFWVRRDAAPLPAGAKRTKTAYRGPEQVTLSSYAADGTVEATADGASQDEGRFIALPIQSLNDAGTDASASMPACVQPNPTSS